MTALSYVKQDQATLKAAKDNIADFTKAEPETYIQAPAELKFDKQQWIDRLKKCSAKALK